MKIVHFADLHIGIESYGRVDPETGLSNRVLDVLNAFDQVIDYCIENKVDLVLFCGDTYKSRDPSQTHQREFAKRLKRLSEAGITVFLLIGNHDLPNAVNRATAVEIFHTLDVDNVYVGSEFDIYKVNTRSGPVQILALPWLKKSALLARDDIKNLTMDQVNEKLEEIMTQRIINLSEKLDDNVPKIMTAHVWVSTAKLGSEKTMMVGKEPALLVGNIALPVFDYVALGHIHRAQVLNENPPVVYAGSLERLDFSDGKLDKGFYEINIDYIDGEKKLDYKFHEISARRFVTVSIDISNSDEDPTDGIVKAIEDADVKEAIVKVQITLSRDKEDVLRESEIYKALKESYYFSIGKEFRRADVTETGIWASEELTPVEALRTYLESKELPRDRMNILMEYGEKIIKEVSGG
jgi:DNA repair protein SbcD/Mre11